MSRRWLYILGGVAAVFAAVVGLLDALRSIKPVQAQPSPVQPQPVQPTQPSPVQPQQPQSGAGLAVFPLSLASTGNVTAKIKMSAISDPYLRYAGAWLDNDYGPDFWEKNQANLGVIGGVAEKTVTFSNVSAGSHKLYVRVSAAQGYQWNICAEVNDRDLGCVRTL
jgi:hypothetical protein